MYDNISNFLEPYSAYKSNLCVIISALEVSKNEKTLSHIRFLREQADLVRDVSKRVH